jgi:hypothetical protein
VETPLESHADTGKATGSEGCGPKQAIINDYLDRLKRIPCRYFEESVKQQLDSSTFRPSCRFGNDCHYAHMHPITGQPHVFSSAELDTIKNKQNLNRRRARQRSAERFLAAQMIILGLADLNLRMSSFDEEEEDDDWSSIITFDAN